MLYLVLAVCCSLAIGMIFKYRARHGADRVALLTVNYAAAVGAALVLLWLEGGRGGSLEPSASLLALGVTTGALFIFGFFMFSLATAVAGMSLSIGVMRVSVVLPFLASWVIWAEVPTVAQGAGLVLAAVAFFLIARTRGQAPVAEPGAGQGRRFVMLALLFLAGGVVDVMMKTFDEVFAADNSRSLFLLMLFAVAFLIGLVIVLWHGVRSGRWPSGSTVAWGVVLGLVNYGSAEFFLRAIRALPGPFVFPANNIALVIGGALLGVTVWGERLSRLNWVGIALAAAALVLLSV